MSTAQKFIKLSLFLGSGLSSAVWAQSNRELAYQVAGLVGIGQSGNCSMCHATGSSRTIRRWGENLIRVKECLENPELASDPKGKLSCISGSDSSGSFIVNPDSLGFYSAALHLEPMQNLLLEAYGAAKAQEITAELKASTMMPLRSPQRFTADEFGVIEAWVFRGMPFLSELQRPQGPGSCVNSMSPKMKEHIVAMTGDNWQTRDRERGMQMFGCAPSGDACFSQAREGQALFPDVTSTPDMQSWKTAAQKELRLLTEFPDVTDYWIRASADGRFVGYGGYPSGIIDLQSRLIPGAEQRVIPVSAYYDPGFFPDDSAFMFQGSGTAICNMSLLKNPNTRAIDFTEDACTKSEDMDIPLYQAIGASLDGNDYLAATGAFLSDAGTGRDYFRRTGVQIFDAEPENGLYLFPLRFDGQRWIRAEAQVFDAGTEIDWGLAPSNRLLVSRKFTITEDNAFPESYQFYQLNRSGNPEQPYLKEPLGQLCLKGLKGNFSFDDRFFVTYNYVEPDQYALLGYASAEDPEFKTLLDVGSGNIFLHDLLTGSTTALTRMGPGQYAQFPHFRADDWIYFMVFDKTKERRYLIVSDAAIQSKRSTPTPTKL